jgi:hypothetical protein
VKVTADSTDERRPLNGCLDVVESAWQLLCTKCEYETETTIEYTAQGEPQEEARDAH